MTQEDLEKRILEIGDCAKVKLFLGKLVLEKIIEANMSCKACNTLAELKHAEAGPLNSPDATEEEKAVALEKAKLAAKYYLISSDQGDVIGTHWCGVFYHEGFGLEKDVPLAVEYLEEAAEEGNGQSMY